MEINKLNEWNTWWENKKFIGRLEGKNRPKYNSLINSIKIKEITIITGVRRSGKSTLMYQMISNLLNQGHLPSPCLTPLEFRQGYEGLILFILCLKK